LNASKHHQSILLDSFHAQGTEPARSRELVRAFTLLFFIVLKSRQRVLVKQDGFQQAGEDGKPSALSLLLSLSRMC
jgi:hypothetical protein